MNPRAAEQSWRNQFGGCDCSLGLIECSCVQACRKPEEPPLSRDDWTLACVIVVCCAIPVLIGPMVMGFLARVL